VIYYFQKSHVKPLNSAINKLHWISPNSLELTDKVKSISETISVSQHLHFLPKLSGTLQWISVYQWIHWHFLIPLFFTLALWKSLIELNQLVIQLVFSTPLFTPLFFTQGLWKSLMDLYLSVNLSAFLNTLIFYLSSLELSNKVSPSMNPSAFLNTLIFYPSSFKISNGFKSVGDPSMFFNTLIFYQTLYNSLMDLCPSMNPLVLLPILTTSSTYVCNKL